MKSIDNDIEQTRLLMYQHVTDPGYGHLYFSSNEELDKIFSHFCFSGKDCLTVLGSGDQAFRFYVRGANGVDLFDINKLAFYYFYLRIWTIKYLDLYYPPYPLTTDFIDDLLEYVEPNTAQENYAFEYWCKYVEEFNTTETINLFLSLGCRNEMADISKINNRIQDSNFNFYNVDISKKININKKYDVIFTSNIIDFLSKRREIEQYRNNLLGLLKDDGIILASKVFSCPISEKELDVFNDYFDCHKLPGNDVIPGYYYTKK